MADDLRTQALSGAKWNVLTSYGRVVIALVSQLVLAWRLDPSDWGLVAAGMMVLTIVRQCCNFGLNYALIHRRDRVEEASHTALTLLFGLSILTYAIVLLVAPHTAAYFSDGAVPLLTKVLALSVFFRPVAVVVEGTLRREFQLRRIFVLETVSQAVSTAAAIIATFLLPKEHRYWALVVGGVGREALRTLTSWWLTNVPIRFRFDRALARELFHYGKYFVGSSIFMVLYANADRLALGRFCSTVGLGLYSFSLGWVFHLGNVSETVFGGVSVPLYAKLQDEPDRLRDSYCRILGYTALIAAGLLTGLVLVIPDAVHLILPERYHLAIQTFQVLGLYYMVRAVDTTTGQLYAAIGRPKLDMALNGVNLVVLAAIIVPLVISFGPAGAALAVLAARAVRLVVNVLICRRAIACPVARFADSVMPAVWASAAMALVLLGVKTQWSDASGAWGWVRLAVLTLGGAGVYIGGIYFAHRRLFAEVLDLVREALAGKKGQREQQT